MAAGQAVGVVALAVGFEDEALRGVEEVDFEPATRALVRGFGSPLL
jgi:hypothetical protein